MCSSFKLALAAFILRRADAGELKLDERVQLNRADLVPHAPVTGPRIESGDPMSWEELAAAAQITSDNVAANVLLRRLGGPEAFTAMARELGDEQTRVDRYEPECNAVWPDDPRDTTTPAAYAGLTAALVHGDVLGPGSRAKLQRWMIETQTGQMRLRAGLPKSWRSGDKTGTMNGADYINRVNDVAVAWPEGGPRLVVSCYYESPVRIDEIRDVDQAVLAQVGSLAATYYEDLLSVSR